MNGRKSKLLRKQGVRTYKGSPELSPKFESHASNLKFDAKLYRERREKGLIGNPQPAVVVHAVFNKKGEVLSYVPDSVKRPPQSNRMYAYQNIKELARQQIAHTNNTKATSTILGGRSNSRGE